MSQNNPSHPYHGHAPGSCEWHEHFLSHAFGSVPAEDAGNERKAALENIKRRLESELSRVTDELKQLT